MAPYAFGGNSAVYARVSGNYSPSIGDQYIEVDTDAGQPITITLPETPANLERHEIWVTPQPSSATVTIALNGQASAGASLEISAALEGRVLLFIRPTPEGGGYWRVTEL